jgi:nucleoid DNA-binding protein
MQYYLGELSVKVEIHQQHNMETVVLNRRLNNQDRKPATFIATFIKMRRAKRAGRNPSTGATLIDRFINRRAKRNGRNPATGA